MSIMARISHRLLPEELTETQRSQLQLGIVVQFGVAVGTGLNALFVYLGGLPEVALAWIILSLIMATSAVFMIFFPLQSYESFVPGALFVFISILVVNLLAHFFSGGYTSGLFILIWLLAAPLSSLLFLPLRYFSVVAVAFVVAVLAAAVLEESAQVNLSPLNSTFMKAEASINMLFLGFQLIFTGLYLFNQVEKFRQQSNDLLLNILPASIADRLKKDPTTIADRYEDVTVLFADIVDFTTMSSRADPVDVVQKLNDLFGDFDRLAAKYGLEKIKTIGDAYMVAGGLPEPLPNHCRAVTEFALEMLEVIEKHTSWTGEPMRIRIGINCGPVVAGVIGQQKFIYDLWGDTVNVASRMESNGLANEIQVTEAVRQRLDGRYEFEERDPFPIKGKGMMVTYLLVT